MIVKMGNGSGRLMDVKQLMEYAGIGRNTAIQFGEECGAVVRIGRRVLYDRIKIDAEIDKRTGEKTDE